jgi:hypothetical protein
MISPSDLAEREVIKLALEAREVRMFEVFRENHGRHFCLVLHLERLAVIRYNRGGRDPAARSAAKGSRQRNNDIDVPQETTLPFPLSCIIDHSFTRNGVLFARLTIVMLLDLARDPTAFAMATAQQSGCRSQDIRSTVK